MGTNFDKGPSCHMVAAAAAAHARALSAAALSVLVLLSQPAGAQGAGDPARGAELYRACVACHALEPGLHLTGPSLGNVLGRRAGQAEGFGRYSSSLRDAGFEWDSAALDGFLADPEAMIAGTYMAFPGVEKAGDRADLVAFLELAGAPGGAERAVASGLIPEAYLRAQAPRPIRDAPPSARVTAIRHCGDSYFVATEDGRETPYWEKNVRLKIDSVEDTGPPRGVPVMVLAGMRGDRVSIIFGGLADLASTVREQC